MARPRLRRVLYVLLGIAIFLFVIWPTLAAFRIRRQITSALRRAESVRLEEFRGSQVITSVELSRDEWHQVVAAMPAVPDTGVPFLVALCFKPHHRVVVMDAADGRTDFIVCFGCEQVASSSSGIIGTPYLWRGSVRRLFTQHHVPIRSLHDYLVIPTPNHLGKANVSQ
ncbi:MAG: hypothetical protein RL693_247 [Verrucomicrobiota bacterium]|jgi:hypothetical protein